MSSASLRQNGLAGGFAAFTGVPGNVAFGILAFAPLGALAAGQGVQAAMMAAVLGTLALVFLGRAGVLLAAPSAPIALIFADLIGRLLAGGVAPEGVLMAAFAAALVCGVALMLLALLRIGKLINFIPQPVLSGILTGTALLILQGQLLPLLRLEMSTPEAVVTFGIILFCAGAVVMGQVLRRPLAGVGLALAGGVLLSLGAPWLGLAAPVGGQALPGGATLPGGAGGTALPVFVWLASGPFPALTLAQAGLVVGAGASMAVLIAISTLVSASHVQGMTLHRVNGNRVLSATGVGVFLGSLLGALPSSGNMSRSAAAVRAGGTGRTAALAYAGVTLAVALVAMPVLGVLPKAVLVGIVVAIGLLLIDYTALRQALTLVQGKSPRPLEALGDLGTVLVVAIATVATSLIVAVALGVACAVVIFLARVSSPVRRVLNADQLTSRLERRASLDALFLEQRARTFAVELQGPLFFGSIDSLTQALDALLERGARAVVLDMRRVTGTDVTFTQALKNATKVYAAQGLEVVLSGVLHSDDRAVLSQHLLVFEDTADALESLDSRLLASLPGAMAEESSPQALAALLIDLGLESAHATAIATTFAPCPVAAGETVIRTGEKDTSIYMVLNGTLDVVLRAKDDAAGGGKRIRTLTAGALFGEMALIDGEPRAADVRARTDALCYRLTRDALARLDEGNPHAVGAFNLMLARLLARRLRAANATINELES